MRPYKKYFREAVLHVFTKKEMTSQSFAQKLYKTSPGIFHDIATSEGNFNWDTNQLTPNGNSLIKELISDHIENHLDMGNNIAQQSISYLKDVDLDQIFKNMLMYATKVKWR